MSKFYVIGKASPELLKKMHEEDWILFFAHDPNFQACSINWDGNKYNKKDSVTISE